MPIFKGNFNSKSNSFFSNIVCVLPCEATFKDPADFKPVGLFHSRASFGVKNEDPPSSVVLRMADLKPLASKTEAEILRHGVVTDLVLGRVARSLLELRVVLSENLFLN